MTKPIAVLVSIYNLGNEISGGDKILLGLIEYLAPNYLIVLICSPEVTAFIKNESLERLVQIVEIGAALPSTKEVGVLALTMHILRRFYLFSKRLGVLNLSHSPALIYSASDFLPDFFAGIALKMKYPSSKWIAGFYLFAPTPFDKNSPYKGIRSLRGVLYWLMQRFTLTFAKKYVDILFVTSPDEKNKALKIWLNESQRIVSIYGGIPLKKINEFIQENLERGLDIQRKYEAIFVGRLHVQKGVIELLNIWSEVVIRIPEARLVIVGDGPLAAEARDLASKLGIISNVEFLGFVDGRGKWELYLRSKIVVHPATYDSGGMAAVEGMAFGLPGVSFDLESLREYYPKGMMKVPCYSRMGFADAVVMLLSKGDVYDSYSLEAHELANTAWGWSSRFDAASVEIMASPGLLFRGKK